jgi:hypothetical protein
MTYGIVAVTLYFITKKNKSGQSLKLLVGSRSVVVALAELAQLAVRSKLQPA